MNLKQLAKELNLSISTVSKALRDSHEISIQTKERVIAMAKKMNYQANPFASSLRKQKSKTIALVIPEIANNFFALAIDGVESVARERGYHVLVYLTHEDTQKEIEITKLLQNGRVDGIMMSISSHTADINHLEELRRNGIPLVLFDRVADDLDSPKVTTDDYNSSYKATEHLIESGCRKIAFLSISDTLSISSKRKNGFLDALTQHGFSPEQGMVVTCNADEQKNLGLIRKLLKKSNRPDCLFASVEKLGINCYQVCEELGLHIPNEVKVISFSNLQTASLLKPSMTAITQPAFEIGREAADILFKLIEKKGYNFIPEKTVLKSVLIERASSQKS